MSENVKRGLAALREQQKQNEERAAAANRPKADWFSWPKGVNVATVRFLQEVDESSPGYREDRDLMVHALEHEPPGADGFKRRALCTMATEDRCYACERRAADPKEGWRTKQNIYINGLVKFEGETEEKVRVIQRNFNSTFAVDLLQEVEDEGSITDVNYRVKRTGTGKDTKWSLKRMPKEEPLDDSNAEVFDINETALRDIPYEKQAEYYGAVYSGPQESATTADATSEDASW